MIRSWYGSSWETRPSGPHSGQWSPAEWAPNPCNQMLRGHWPACRPCWESPWSPLATRLPASHLTHIPHTWVIEKVFVLLNQLLGTQVAVLVEEVDLEDLLAVWSIGVGKDIGHEEGEDVAEGTVADVGGEGIVVVGVEELSGERCTNREEMPPAYAQYLLRSMTGKGIWSSHSAVLCKGYGREGWEWRWERGCGAGWILRPGEARGDAQRINTSWFWHPWRGEGWRPPNLWGREASWR